MTRLALMGFGKWGAQLLDSVQGTDSRAQFAAIVSSSPERVKANPRAASLTVHPTLDAALNDKAIDGLVLATPHSLHAEQVAACAAKGKHVFVEKPFALTRESCRQALDAAAKAGIVVAVGHNRRFLPAAVRLKELIAAGELGTIMHIETTYTGDAALHYETEHWRSTREESPAGGLAGSGIHMIDAIIGFAGPISTVAAFTARRAVKVPIDDTTAVLFRLACGATASLTNIVATVRSYGIHVFGSAAAAEMRGADQLIVTKVGGKPRTEDFAPANTMRLELEAFVDAIEGRAAFPITPDEIANGVATFELVCRAVERNEIVTV